MALQNLIENCSSLWSSDFQKHVIYLLKNWKPGVKKTKSDYRIYAKYVLKTFSGLDQVVTKDTNKIVATKETVLTAIKSLHEDTTIHKGIKKHIKLLKKNTQTFQE